MTRVEALEQEVEKLSPEELSAFRDWFAEYDWQMWDRQLERDVADGKLDDLAAVQSCWCRECGRPAPVATPSVFTWTSSGQDARTRRAKDARTPFTYTNKFERRLAARLWLIFNAAT